MSAEPHPLPIVTDLRVAIQCTEYWHRKSVRIPLQHAISPRNTPRGKNYTEGVLGPEEVSQLDRLRTHVDALESLAKAVAGRGRSLADDCACGRDGDLCIACDAKVMPAIQALLGRTAS